MSPPAPVASRLRAAGTEAAYLLGWAAVRRLPEPVVTAGFALGARAAYHRSGRGVRRLRENLARVLAAAGDTDPGRLEEVHQAAIRSYARYWQEVFRLGTMPTSVIVDGMHVRDERRLRDAYAAGQGMILALPHMGNYDHAGAWLAATGVPFTTVAERLDPPEVFDKFVALRTRLGMEVLPLTGGPRPPLEVCEERLRSGGACCLVADRDLSASGVPVEFFGATTRMPAGPALLALRTGAALLPVTLSFIWPRGWRARIHPRVCPPAAGDDPVATMTQQLADAFAEGIAEYPQDWHMLQRLWPDAGALA